MRAFFFTAALAVSFSAAADPTPNPAPAAPAAPAFCVPSQQEAQKLAETVYNTWRISIMRGNETAWRGITSTSRLVKARNLIISQKGNFPADFFKSYPEPPQLENFRFVGALANATRDTMAVTYMGRVQLGNGKPHVNAYVLQLVCERGKWKLDTTALFDLVHLPKVQARLEKGDMSVLKEQDGFQPYAVAPAVPTACKAPELIAKVFIDCPGREIDMRINGISAHEFSDTRRADVVSGGLRRGTNTITYHIKDIEGKAHPAMAIGLFVMPETPGNHPVCVFDHILDETDTAKGGSFTFEVSNAQIASMNPQFNGPAPQPLHAVPLKQKPADK